MDYLFSSILLILDPETCDIKESLDILQDYISDKLCQNLIAGLPQGAELLAVTAATLPAKRKADWETALEVNEQVSRIAIQNYN